MSTTRPSALVASILSMLLVMTVAAPTTAADAEPEYRFTGYGTDHGVGLSQRGAAGRAEAGQGYDQILAHYFRKTRLASVPEDTSIRALVIQKYRATGAQTRLLRGYSVRKGVDANGDRTVGMRWSVDTPDPAVEGLTFAAGASLVIKGSGATGAWHLQVQDSSGTVLADFMDSDARLVVKPVAPVTGDDALGAIKVLIRPTTKYDTYMGDLRIGRLNGRIRIVNVVPIEPFVRSVTPQELGPSNHIQALRAQAVVARSYFLAGLRKGTGFLDYDVESYRDSQSYKGIKGQKGKTTEATDDTQLQVVAFKGTAPSSVRRVRVLIDGAPDPAYYIARTFYHAVGGGATEASHNVFTGSKGTPGSKTPYLKGGPDVDEDGAPYDEDASGYSWRTRSLTLDELSAILAKDSRTNVGKLISWPIGSEASFRTQRAAAIASDPRDTTPSPSYRGISGRLTWVRLKGVKDGRTVEKQVAGWLFKSVFNSHRGSGDPIGSTMIFRTAVD